MTASPAGLWLLDPDIDFLNHGSFGATPVPVLEVQAEWRRRMETEPVRFFQRDLEPALDDARKRLAGFLGARSDDVAFVPNATTAVNGVLRSYPLAPGDEVVVSNHIYPACRSVARFVTERAGARLVTAGIPFPITGPDEVLDAYESVLTERTRLVIAEHITSATALVMPVQDIARLLAGRGIDVLIDGAHAPGSVPLDLDAIGATFYVGNCHKWLSAPKGAGFLHVDAARSDTVVPAVVSSGFDASHESRSPFRLRFDWTGTDDPSAYLSVPAAIDVMSSLHPDGFPGLMRSNQATALRARAVLCGRLETEAPAPDTMIASMASVPLPDAIERPTGYGRDPLQDRLLFEHNIEVPIEVWPAWPSRNVRISVQAYNRPEQYEKLATALESLLG